MPVGIASDGKRDMAAGGLGATAGAKRRGDARGQCPGAGWRRGGQSTPWRGMGAIVRRGWRTAPIVDQGLQTLPGRTAFTGLAAGCCRAGPRKRWSLQSDSKGHARRRQGLRLVRLPVAPWREAGGMGCTNGIEPSSAGSQPAALPLSYAHHEKGYRKWMEVRTGFKPVSADLQSAAWSLCYRTLESLLVVFSGSRKDRQKAQVNGPTCTTRTCNPLLRRQVL